MLTRDEAIEREMLQARSERNKIALPMDARLRKLGHTKALRRLCKDGRLVLLDQVASLPHLAQDDPNKSNIPLAIYLVTRKGLAWLAEADARAEEET